MAKKLNKWKSAEEISAPKRLLSFFIDWASWGYVAYVIVYLLNFYWYTVYVDWYGKLTPPGWAWPLILVGTFELAALCRAFTHSLGMRALGMRLTAGGRDLKTKRRVFLFLAYNLNGLLVGLSFLLGRWLGSLGGWEKLHLDMILAGTISLLAFSLFFGLFPWHEKAFKLEYTRLPSPAEWTQAPPPWYRTGWGILAFFLFIITVVLGWHVTEAHLKALASRAARTAYLWRELVQPNFSYLSRPDPWLGDSILGALAESIFMALFATIAGAAFAFPLSFLGARNMMDFNPLARGVYFLTRGFFNVFRSVESMLWAVIFAIWVGWGPFAGTLALALHTIAALGKLYSEQVEHIDPGPVEAITAAGASRLEVIRYAVIPQVIPPFLAFTFYRWDINIRMATVVGLVGGGGIGRLLFYYKNKQMWHYVGAVALAIALVVWALDYVSGRLREKIV